MPPADAPRRPVRTVARLLGRIARTLLAGAIGALLVLLVIGVVHLERRPELAVWHTAELDEEFEAEHEPEGFAGYLARERRLFAQLAERVDPGPVEGKRGLLNRYRRGSLADPARWPTDWNRTVELARPAPRAGVLMLHGMSDSPYSMHTLAGVLHARGAHVVALRLPGHGTAPVGLVEVTWEDMAAAVRAAMRHLQATLGDVPLFVVGYSNGGSLAVRYALDALEDPELPSPAGLVLISPSIRVTPAAALAVWQARLGWLLGLPRLAWASIGPEFDPFKYVSFAVNAGDQVHRITTGIRRDLDRLGGAGRLGELPPVLAFQSIVDATVSTRAVIDGLFQLLPAGGHRLVLFDLNRHAATEELFAQDPRASIRAELGEAPLSFTVEFVTNTDKHRLEVELRRKRAGTSEIEVEPLPLAWPQGVYSLSHVALPFPPTDPLNGGPEAPPSPGVEIGRAELRGERGVLLVTPTELMRLRWNPFYALIEERTLAAMSLSDAR
ncbi:MAG: alpha/beta fold hydrolase [Myxococcota bacterium]|nr:alpha/beta fold hydrolase [Myxococcota bacterium]